MAKIDDLVNRAKDLGMEALALTDHGNLYGAIEFYKKAKKAGIKPIIGCEFYTAFERMQDKRPGIDNKRYHLTVLARDDKGYRNLVKLVTVAHLEGFYYKPRIDRELLRTYGQGLVILSGCFASEISRAITNGKPEHAEKVAREYQDIVGRENFYIELGAHFNFPEQKSLNDGLTQLAAAIGAKRVATNDIHYVAADDTEAHEILMSVQTGNRFDDEDRLTMKGTNLSMRTADEMAELFPNDPDVIETAGEIAERCSVDLKLGQTLLPHFPVPEGHDTNSYLAELAVAGLERRYGSRHPGKEIEDRLAYELETIQKTGFAGYFLIVQDFVNWAKQNGIVVGPGRGSAAGSLVSYLLNITNIDPIAYNLLFERFLNPERISMPDIDLDFTDVRRDEVLEYVAEKYGRDHVAQIITFGTMAARAAIRDTGRALGMPYSFCDRVAKLIPFNPTQGEKTGWLKKSLENVLELRELYRNDAEVKRLIDAAMKLEGVARHASTHACGVVMSPKPLVEYVPLQYAMRNGDSKENGGHQAIVTQFEMKSVEEIGLLKMDFLGLRNLSIIETALKLIRERHAKEIDIDTIPLNDAHTFELFQRGETTGVFQFESSGMKRYLKELKPTHLEDLIAMVALYRPGPIELIPSYIARKHGREQINYLHPKLEPILQNTYGIGVYQEQMMQIARDCAGYTLPEADTLRKAIGKKIKSLLDEQGEKLTAGMLARGIEKETAQAIWDLFPPFARYGFNRSHAACYALIAYQTGYLKATYPTEFMAALFQAEGFEVERIAFLVEETRAMDIEVLPPDINESFETFTVVEEKKIRFGLGAVKNVGQNVVHAIIEERIRGERFTSITNFIERVKHKDLNKKSLESLVKCGALDMVGERNQILGNIDMLLDYNRESQKTSHEGLVSLFAMSPQAVTTSIRLKEFTTATKKERLAWEKELLGLYITEHPMSEYAHKLKVNHALPLKNLTPQLRDQRVSIGGVVNAIQKIVTKSGEPMLFVKLEDLTAKTEVLVFPKVLARNPALWQLDKILLVRGRLSDKDGVPKILCEEAIEIV